MPEHPILDPEPLRELRALSPDDGGAFVRELIEIFLQETAPRLDHLQKAFAAGDAAEVNRVAHSIKGSCGNLGAMRLQAAAQQIEQLAKTGEVARAAPLLPEIQAAYAATHRALDEVLRDLR